VEGEGVGGSGEKVGVEDPPFMDPRYAPDGMFYK